MAGSFSTRQVYLYLSEKTCSFYRHAFGRSCQRQVLTNEIIDYAYSMNEMAVCGAA